MVRLVALLVWLACAQVHGEANLLPGPYPGGSVTTSERIQIFQVPEPGRVVLLVLGIGALTLTYRRFWINMREKMKN